MISFEEFEKLADAYNVVPLVRMMLADMHTPVSTYLALRQEGVHSFLFESVEANEKIGRYSFVGVGPSFMIRTNGRRVEIEGNVKDANPSDNIFELLEHVSTNYRQAPLPSDGPGEAALPGLSGGLVGYLGYDAVRHLEKIPIPVNGQEDESAFGFFPSIVRFDHRRQVMTLIHNIVVDRTPSLRQQYEDGRKTIEALELRLRRTPVANHNFRCTIAELTDGSDREDYCRGVTAAKRHILEGDIFQVVLSRRVQLTYSGDLFSVYRALRIINPSPYLYYVDFGETKLVGSSPEVFVRAHDGQVEVLPIAGTRRRGTTDLEDLALEQELLRDEKELAEHVMLVDLGRNDVGRICKYGSVEVPVFKRVERYSHVMHIVSEVRGELLEWMGPVGVLKACFPAGTVSGAPKVRAMEIINKLELNPRGIYAGAVGYVGANGALDMCIAIRTIVAHGPTLSIRAGAGIVADSVPEKEYQETVNKSRALLDAVAHAANGLSMFHSKIGHG